MKPIEDKVEVSIDFPDKFYVGSFERESEYDAVAEGDGLRLRFHRGGSEQRKVEIHLHHYVLAGALSQWAESLEDAAPIDHAHAAELKKALKDVETALGRTGKGRGRR